MKNMKGILIAITAGAALLSGAGEVTFTIDTTGPSRNAFPHDAPFVGYAADPQAGGEEAAVACRRAGAWLFRTTKADDATLKFCAQYGLRLFLVLDGDQKECVAALNRLSQNPDKGVIAGLQIGSDPSGKTDSATLRKVAALAARLFPNTPLALPVKDLNSASYTALAGSVAPFTHLMVDLRDAPAPYEKLEGIAGKLRRSPDKSVSELRLWAVGPGRLASMAEGEESSPKAVAWQMHWIMAAMAVDRTDGVFLERAYRADDFGLAMRHLWAVTTLCRKLVGHGEGATEGEAKQSAKAAHGAAGLSLDGDDFGSLELDDAYTPGPAPVACANVAAGKPGDVEYLAFLGPPMDKDGSRVFIFIVNTSGESMKISVDVNKNGGNVSSGWRRRLVPDAEKGVMLNSTRERFSKPLAETVEPGEVTFLDFRI